MAREMNGPTPPSFILDIFINIPSLFSERNNQVRSRNTKIENFSLIAHVRNVSTIK
jgi:hypothetical protein